MANGYEYPLIDGLDVDEVIAVVAFFFRKLKQLTNELQELTGRNLSRLIISFNAFCQPKWNKSNWKRNFCDALAMIHMR